MKKAAPVNITKMQPSNLYYLKTLEAAERIELSYKGITNRCLVCLWLKFFSGHYSIHNNIPIFFWKFRCFRDNLKWISFSKRNIEN